MAREFPANVSKPVACLLPGYEGTEATFVISRSQKQLQEAQEAGTNQLAATVVAEFTLWPFDAAKPKAGEADSFQVCPIDLLAWVCGPGYQEALKSAISPN